MAIQMRRGSYSDFDSTKLLPGEWAIVTSGDPATSDGRAAYLCTSSGVVRRFVSADEIYDFLENLTIDTADIADGAITASKIANGAVSAAKLMNGAVTESKIANGSVTDSKLDPTGLISDFADLRDDFDNLDVELDPDDFSLEQDSETGLVYVVYRGERGSDGIPLAGGGGGGGGGGSNNAIITVTNETGWLSHTVSTGASCEVELEWSSLEDGLPTGDGSLQVTVGGVVRVTRTVSQGAVTVDLGPYLSAGTNKAKVRISDVYDNSRTVTFTVTAVDLTLSSSFDTSGTFPAGETVEFTYTPKGATEKTVHFSLDGTELTTETVTTSGRQQSKTLPAMAHGAHSLLVWFTAEIGGETVSSNSLYFEMAVVSESGTAPIITSMFRATTAAQYDLLSIPYRVYKPNSLTADVTLKANGTTVQSVTVGRTEQEWSYRCDSQGALTLAITCGVTTKSFSITVSESGIDIEPETEALSLHLTSEGRTNTEAHPEVWEDESNDISATLSGFDFVSNGWVSDPDGATVLRVNNGAGVTIPYQPFASDFRATGKTIEVEMAVRDVLDYDAVALGCMSGGRGLKLTAQFATLASEQTTIQTQYKEDEHVRVSFVAQKRNEDRLLLTYINGIVSGCVQYPADDDFSQQTPVGITIGDDGITVDVYCIRVYDMDLTRYQVLGNWIADTRDAGLMLDRYHHNDVYDEYGQVVIEKLPVDLPYFILEAPELPQYKGDKKTISGSYVDPSNPARGFTFTGCQINVQGTSSAPYARKNYDMQFKNGFEMQGGTHADAYALSADVIPFNRFVLKADVASSEGANNVELVKLFCEADPYKRPEEIADPKVRKGIYGFPIVVFWHDTATDRTSLLGKYNFNFPKRAPEPYGYSGLMESWEFQNNTSLLMLFQSDYFDETMYTDPTTGDTKELWRYDYEARFPEDTWTDYDKLQELQSFVYSTYRANATGDAITPVTYEGVTYSTDTAAYRLAKFRAEFGNYAEVDSFIFYYLFTELFLMVDSRAKNLFIGFSGGATTGLTHIDRKAVAEPYDMDTALGTNNEGSLVFGYSLEDTDTVAGANVFNGQTSVLWCNLRDAFPSEISTMYQLMRSQGILSYANVQQRFADHQAKWPEAIFNEDAWFKYLSPLIDPDPGKEPTDVYLPMLQGSKAEQRKWWLFNRFRYMDSRWLAGDATTYRIQLRGYAKADITVTPYSDIYPTVQYGSYFVGQRGTHGTPTTLACPIDTLNDTEIYIYSAPQLQSVGDLSGLKVGFADFSQATKLTGIKVGSDATGYTNPNLTSLSVGTNNLLASVDATNCTALTGTVDLSGARNVEHVLMKGTAITSVTLPVGGILKELRLPATVTNLTVRDQPQITTFDFSGTDYSSVTTLRVENSSTIPVLDILADMAANSRVRIIGFTLAVTSTDDVEDFYDFLDTMRGLDEYGNNLDHAVAAGTITGLGTITGAWLAQMEARYPDITITYEHISSTLTYKSWDGLTTIQTETISDGGDGTYSGTPTRTSTPQYSYTFAGWSLDTDSQTADPNATKGVVADRTVYAAYSRTLRTYTVRFYNGTTLLQTVNNVAYGGSATYTGTEPTDPDGESKPFMGWMPQPTNIQANTDCYAQYLVPEPAHTITDTWEEIIQHVQAGDYASRYSVGDTMSLNLGAAGYVNMVVAGINLDTLAGGGKAHISWISEPLLRTKHRMNPPTEYYTKDVPSWAESSTTANLWNTSGVNYTSTVAEATWVLTATAAGTISIAYKSSNANGGKLALTVNGTVVESGYTSKTEKTHSVTVNTGDTVTVHAAYDRTPNPNNTYYGQITFSGAFSVSANVSDAPTRDFNHLYIGTGAVGGWEHSEMRAYLKGTIKPLIPAVVRNAIVEVSKQQSALDTDKTFYTQTTIDDLWIPSKEEVTTSSYGKPYRSLFMNTASRRVKHIDGQSSGTSWPLRDAYGVSNTDLVVAVSNTGAISNWDVSANAPIALGFCI